jgi:hypothetical protein
MYVMRRMYSNFGMCMHKIFADGELHRVGGLKSECIRTGVIEMPHLK